MEKNKIGFTREMFLSMTSKQIREFYWQKQRDLRAAGKDHYIKLLDGKTFEVVSKIEGKEDK